MREGEKATLFQKIIDNDYPLSSYQVKLIVNWFFISVHHIAGHFRSIEQLPFVAKQTKVIEYRINLNIK